ncbi:MAG: tyrosine-type recombinase/integrase [Gammaproteobacteria bacterium]|nr:tyrosine-type recombinase/integrase [Gammaproteobacteria bacterium]MBP9729572.1 tyrosine-type recombinase/integrase [Gammaproteobacteria bacterium]
MGRKQTSGLIKRGKTWHIEKRVFGRRLRESTGTEYLSEAERYLARRLEELRQASVYGVRPKRLFKEAATKYLLENQHKASIADDALHIKLLCGFIGDLVLEQVHSGTLKPFIEARQAMGRKTKTINNALEVVRHILRLAADEWVDEHGLSWLLVAPKIKLLPVHDSREPYPLSWDEQTCLFNELPEHLKKMALFKVNTGCREQEVCQLRWEWEREVPELKTSVFIIPSHVIKHGKRTQLVKNGKNRLVVLNAVAKAVIEQQRALHPVRVFAYRGKPIGTMNNSAWQRVRTKMGLPQVRIHDLKHTFGRRLRASGVGYEDRQDLLGHKSERLTTHYSSAELHNLIAAAEKACECHTQSPVSTLLRPSKQVSYNNARKMPTTGVDAGQRSNHFLM